jgi:hypothetical protein
VTANVTTTASGNATAAGNATTGTGTVDAQYQLLANFVNLTPERLSELRKLIDKLDDMSVEDREALRERVMQQMQLLQELRRDVGPATREMSPRDRDVLRRYYFSLVPEDTQAWLDRAKAQPAPDQMKALVRDMLTSAATRGIAPDTKLSDKPVDASQGPGGPGGPGRNDRGRGGPPQGGDWFGPFGPDGGARGLPPPKRDDDGDHHPPPPAPPPSNTTVTPAPGNTTAAGT